jgi:hypothetical protein
MGKGLVPELKRLGVNGRLFASVFEGTLRNGRWMMDEDEKMICYHGYLL